MVLDWIQLNNSQHQLASAQYIASIGLQMANQTKKYDFPKRCRQSERRFCPSAVVVGSLASLVALWRYCSELSSLASPNSSLKAGTE